jgi:hypothetical protein
MRSSWLPTRILWGLLCLGTSFNALADTPLPWGLRVFSQESERLPAPLALSPDVLAQLDTASERIATIERLQGPYSADLTDPLLETAHIAAEYGEVDRAMELYRWGLYTLRVNQGLNSAEQLPVIERMLALLRSKGDSEAFQDRIDYLYRLMGRGAKPWTEDRLLASQRWLRTRTELLITAAPESSQGELLFLLEHAEGLREEVCNDAIWASQFCAQLTLRLLALLYVLDYRVEPLIVDSYGSVQRSSYAESMGYNNDLNLSPLEQRLLSLEQGVRSRGRRILDKALEISPADVGLTRALADWFWFYGRTGEALDLYRGLAGQTGELQSEGGLIGFQTPTPIPISLFEPRDSALISREIERYHATAMVNKRGVLKDIELLPADPERTSLKGRGVRHLKSVRFSPVLDKHGNAQETWISLQIAVIK